MANKGSSIATNQYLSIDDYLVSATRLFFAVMQGDGNLCVYRGSSPSDNRGFLWGALKESQPGGQFFAVMQSDGNLCVYKGTGPADNRGFLWGALNESQPDGQFVTVMQDDGNLCVYKAGGGGVWCTMAIDPVVGVENSSIEYDVAAATILHAAPAELYRQIVHNDTTQPQASAISGSGSVSEASGWSDSLAVSVGVSASFETGVPVFADGKVTVSVGVTNTYTSNGSTTTTKTWGFNSPVSVAPHTTIVGLVAATLSTIAVPYTLSGTFVLKSGARIPGSVKGLYTGSNSHDLTVTFIQRDSVTSQNQSTTQTLEATLI